MMRRGILLASLLLAPSAALQAAGAPELVAPVDGAVLTTGIPHFLWQRALTPSVDAMPSYDIQIAADDRFERVVDEDRLAAVIGWYVPDRELGPGDYWWRLACVDPAGGRGAWSPARALSVRPPANVVRVPRGSTFADIQRAFVHAATQTPATVRFEPGDYRLDPGTARVFIGFTNTTDLVIDGSGASLVFTRPLSLIQATDCRRVLVKGFTFDFDPPAYTAGRVTAVDAKKGWIEAEILPGHALPDAWPAYARETKGMIVTGADGFAMKRGVPLVVSHAGFEHAGERRFRFRFERPKAAAVFAPGDVYVLDPRWYAEGGGHGASAYGGEDVVFHGLTIRSAANECLGSFYSDRHAILHVNLERPPGRALSVNNGGNNHHNARTGPWIEGCLFENCGDDVCHVNGYAMGVTAQPAPDRLVINRRQPYDQFGDEARLDMRPGDRLVFFNRRAGTQVAEAKVASVAAAEKTVEVTVDRPVAGVACGRLVPAKGVQYAAAGNPEVTECYNASRMCNQFVFRRNIARNSRRIGVLAKGDGGLVEGNTFENLGGGGVEFWNAPFEGLAAENYVVRDNRILNCGRIARTHAAIWATMFAGGGDRLHRGLLITGNEITGFPGTAILLGDLQNAVVRDNRIAPAPPLPPAPAGAEPVVLRNTAAVRLDSNTVVNSKP
jgi:hypothetical protein